MSQSPIQFKLEESLLLAKPTDLFECHYKPKDKIEGCFEGHPGHGKFVVKNGSAQVKFRGAWFELKQIHLHKGSEHIIEFDDHYDLEIHFVHAPLGSSVASPLVVIGVLFRIEDKIDKKSQVGKIFDQFLESAKSVACTTIKPLDLFPKFEGNVDKTRWFHYEGSLTSFPFSENVSWIVMNETAALSRSLVGDLVACTEQEKRELQPLDRRLVVRSFEKP